MMKVLIAYGVRELPHPHMGLSLFGTLETMTGAHTYDFSLGKICIFLVRWLHLPDCRQLISNTQTHPK